MELTDTDIEQLESYQEGTLTEGERLALEKRLAEDPVFRQEAELLWALTAGLSVAGEEQTRAFLKGINKTMPPVPPPPKPWLNYLLVALALAAIGVWYFLMREEEKKVSPAIAACFEPYPVLGITMSGSSQVNPRLLALRSYASNDFKKAIPLLERAFETERDSTLLFYKGISYLALGDNEKAIFVLELMQNSYSITNETLTWYLTLAYIASGEKEKASFLIQKLSNTEGGYQKKVKECLKDY